MRRFSGCLQESNHGGLFRVEVTTNQRYRKIPKISPGAYIFQWPFLRGLFLEGLIFEGAYLRRGICVLKSIGLAYSWKEIYRFCFVLLCIWGQFPSTSPPGGFYSEGRCNGGFFALRVWGAYIWRGFYKEGLIFGILRYFPNTWENPAGKWNGSRLYVWKVYMGSVRNYGLWFAAMQFFNSF